MTKKSRNVHVENRIFESYEQWRQTFLPKDSQNTESTERNISKIAVCLANNSIDKVLRQSH